MRKSLIGFFTLCLMGVLGLAMHPAAPTQPGMTPYTPTRLEWLALDLEASYHQDFGRDSNYSLHYLPKPPNTVLIFVDYKSEASTEAVNHAIDSAKEVVSQDASSHGWRSWVKVEVQRKLIQKEKRKGKSPLREVTGGREEFRSYVAAWGEASRRKLKSAR